MIYPCQFGLNLDIASVLSWLSHSYLTLVTLKIRSMSPKSNHSFQLSSSCASLVKIHQTVQKLELRQKTMRTPTDSAIHITSAHIPEKNVTKNTGYIFGIPDV